MVLSPLKRGALALGSAVSALTNPANAESVAVFGELTARPVLRRLRTRLMRDPVGREMLTTCTPARFPSNGASSLTELRALPAGSLGHEYAKFMDSRGFDPEDRLPVRFLTDPQDRWVVQRYRDVHDMWHVLTAMPTNLMGEITLKWFEAAHTGLPAAVLAAAGAPARLTRAQRSLVTRELAPWAVEAALSARDLLAIRYEDHLHRPIAQCRAEWNIRTVYVTKPEVLYGKKWKHMMKEARDGAKDVKQG